jgi:hypothetical protein
MILIHQTAVKKWYHSMHMPSGIIKSGSSNNNNNNCTEHALNATTMGIALCNAKGSSRVDANKKGDPVDVAGCKAESLGKEDEDGIAFTLISQEKEVGYIISEHNCLS